MSYHFKTVEGSPATVKIQIKTQQVKSWYALELGGGQEKTVPYITVE